MFSFQLPLLMKPACGGSKEGEPEGEPQKTINPFSIMQEIAKAVYLEEILFGKANSQQRTEVR